MPQGCWSNHSQSSCCCHTLAPCRVFTYHDSSNSYSVTRVTNYINWFHSICQSHTHNLKVVPALFIQPLLLWTCDAAVRLQVAKYFCLKRRNTLIFQQFSPWTLQPCLQCGLHSQFFFIIFILKRLLCCTGLEIKKFYFTILGKLEITLVLLSFACIHSILSFFLFLLLSYCRHIVRAIYVNVLPGKLIVQILKFTR